MPDNAVRRRSGAPSKGDLRELKILEVLEIDAITAILVRAGVPDRAGPAGARAVAGAVCWMIERTFYHASAVSPEALDQASETCRVGWLRVAGIEP
jgi:TetR/AcrR family transcriptional regulator, ethionamide resistance regulator